MPILETSGVETGNGKIEFPQMLKIGCYLRYNNVYIQCILIDTRQ